VNTSLTAREARELWPFLTAPEQDELATLIAYDIREVFWRPLPGPQTLAYESIADVIGYGGGAGGGKTDLAIGKALTQHQRVAYFRVEGTELEAVYDRLEEMLGSRDGFNGQSKVWRNAGPLGVKIDFGSVPNPGDERKHRGRPKDLLVIDEAGEFTEAPVRFLMGWVRSTDPRQRKQTLLCFNPPTRAECRWIIKFFAPWLDPAYPGVRAMPGELRYFARHKGDSEEREVDSGEPYMADGELVIPQSRTFIPALVGDNPFLHGTGYMAQLQALPEPLRSQMLYGDMTAGMEDDAYQVIPTAWVNAAMKRWVDHEALGSKPVQDSIGVDPARGGKDNTCIARRAAMWFDKPLVYPGLATPDGPKVAALVIGAMQMHDRPVVHIDVDGIGASPYDFLVTMGIQTVGIKNATGTPGQADQSGMLLFANLRSLLWWRMREALDPMNNTGIMLPPDERLREELCMPRYQVKGKTIYIESREDLLDPKRLGRSPDLATAYVMALVETPKVRAITALQREVERQQGRDYDPYEQMNRR
jgi:hypothetical protein